jgi:CRISPR-associated protein Cas5t
MLGIYVAVPVACFRKGLAREYLETEPLPPPATCYGFLLSLVGESNRHRHAGVRVAPALLDNPLTSVVLRTVWRVKKTPLGSAGNTRPDYQQLLTGVKLIVWLDSSEERTEAPTLEDRVRMALDQPRQIDRFGGLSLGESTHLVDEVRRLRPSDVGRARTFLLAERGRLSLPVWVDHVGSAGTRFVTGDLSARESVEPPTLAQMALIEPPCGKDS